ncbi:MAG: cation diffusion facilitator family transporter [Oscillospiraceae bacterium]|nr:cation diffusion facilitator family transporter [Oscillospiraceae bacterium]
MPKREKSREQVATFVSGTNIIANLLLSGVQFIVGYLANSHALMSGAVHTVTDAWSSFFVIVGVRLGAKKSDSNHQYGHERFESVAAILYAIFVAVTGILIGWGGVRHILEADMIPLEAPGILALVVAGVTFLVKEGMYWRTRRYAKRINSAVLMADAWHSRTDAFGSLGVFAAILGARMGLPILDPIASLIICVFILKAAVSIFLDAIAKMTDRAADKETETKIRAVVEAYPGVAHLDLLRTRLFGDRVYVDIEIAMDRDLPLHAAHDIAQGVHNAVEAEFPIIKHCMVHMNPMPAPLQSEGASDMMDES